MSSRGVCPGLYRTGNKFYCKFAGGAEVDPAFLPCVADYWSCEFYKKQEEKRRAPQPPQVPQQAVAAVEIREEPRVTTELRPPPPPQPVAAADEVEELVRRAVDLGKMWEEYEREARAIVDSWEEVRERLRKDLLGLEKAIEAYEAEIERLEARLKLGVLSEKEYEEVRSRLDAELAQRLSSKELLERKLADLDRAVIPHFKRVKATEVKPEIAKMRIALSKLEQKFKSGEIPRDVYERLKSEIEEKIRRLEKIREEVEEL
ncbi:MAG: hypothetical protein QXT33_06520 [Thermofilum sp.]